MQKNLVELEFENLLKNIRLFEQKDRKYIKVSIFPKLTFKLNILNRYSVFSIKISARFLFEPHRTILKFIHLEEYIDQNCWNLKKKKSNEGVTNPTGIKIIKQ